MILLIKLIAIAIAGMGLWVLLNPEAMRRMLAFWGEGNRLYLAGVIRIFFAAILLGGASQCRSSGVVIVLGVLFLIGGISIFVLKPEKLKSILRWWYERPLWFCRLLALLPLGIALLLIYAI